MSPQEYYRKIRERFPKPVCYDPDSSAYVITTAAHAKRLLCHVLPKSMGEIVVGHDDNVEGHREAVDVLNALFTSMRSYDGNPFIQAKLDHGHHFHCESEHLKQLIAKFYNEGVSVDLMNDWLRPAVSRIMFDVVFGRDRVMWCHDLYLAAYDFVKFLDGKYLSNESFISGMAHLRRSLSEHLEADWSAIDEVLPAFCHFAVGHETPANIVGNIVGYSKGMDASVVRCIYEAIRFDPPIQILWRYVDKSVEVDGCQLDIGQKVCIHLGLASRDRGAFTDPDAFSTVNSTEYAGIFFGSSTKGCPGRHIAFDIARCLLDVIDGLRMQPIPDSIRWFDTSDVRGMDRLMVSFSPREVLTQG